MSKKTFEDYENEYSAIAEKIKTELNFLESSIKEETEKEAKAQADVEKAFNACNTKAYRAAQNAVADAQNSQAMFKQLLENKKLEHHMSREDFNAICKDIHGLIDNVIAEEREKLLAVADIIDESAQRIVDATQRGNELIKGYQRVVYNDDQLRSNMPANRVYKLYPVDEGTVLSLRGIVEKLRPKDAKERRYF